MAAAWSWSGYGACRNASGSPASSTGRTALDRYPPASVGQMGGVRKGDPARPPLLHEGQGQQIGQDMEPQGQMGRRSSAHEPCATRRFQRDAVVFDDYTIQEGMLIPQGAIRDALSP